MYETDPWKSLAYYQHEPSNGSIIVSLVLAIIGLGIWVHGLDDGSLTFVPTATTVEAEAGEEHQTPAD